jgi:apolipoprotein N-acyltransferase
VLWPENSSDIDPVQNPDAAAQIDRAARAVGVPIMVGTILRNPPELANADGPTATNSTLVWEPGAGPVARNDKRRIQPFGEYMPFRSFFRMFSPTSTGPATSCPARGRGPSTSRGADRDRDLLGDRLRRPGRRQRRRRRAGARRAQQQRDLRLQRHDLPAARHVPRRAVEFDRAAIVATTSGVSATVARDGTVTARTGQFEPGVLVDRTVLRDTTTIAARLRSAPEWALVALGAGAVLLAVTQTGVRRSRRERGAVDG